MRSDRVAEPANGVRPTEPMRHRADIDGLRAFAILPILLLHCGLPGLRGGFVGVDIFFVISGYLITSIITRELAAGSFTLTTFYRRRVVRILPALLAMMAIVMVAGCVIFLPNQIRDLGWSMAATSVFGSNFYFYATSDYFAQASDAKPLIHTWSLAVEEQFYLLYPLMLMALRDASARRLATIIAWMALASFAIGAWLAFSHPSAGFFLLPARIWELSLGALVALGAHPVIASARLRALLCLGALATIVASCVAIGSSWPFPVPFAAPPAFAAAVLIAYGETGPTARLLALAPLRWIGLISYSIYLWHRPLISFYQNATGTSLSLSDALILVTVSIAAGAASYILVERPALRRWRSGRGLRPHAVALAVLGIFAAAGIGIAAYADTVRPLSPQMRHVASYLGFDTTPAGKRQFSADRCFLLPTGKPFDPTCLTPDPVRRNILLVGDSHAAHFSQALREALPGDHILQATAAGCRPLMEGRGWRGCRAVMNQAFHKLDFARVDTVILSGLWHDFENRNLVETVRDLRARGVRVVVIGPSVEYDLDLPTLIVRAHETRQPALPERYLIRDRIAGDVRLRPLIEREGAIYFSAISWECGRSGCARLTRDGAPLHFDHSHFTDAGARALIGALVSKGAFDDHNRPDPL